MKAYYERRAPEYDHWWLATGPYEGRERPRWREEVERLVALLRSLPPAPTLDVACGTGFLTQFLPGEVTALDQSESMLEIAAERLPAARIVHGDALELPFADGEFERVFTAHFYGHLDAGAPSLPGRGVSRGGRARGGRLRDASRRRRGGDAGARARRRVALGGSEALLHRVRARDGASSSRLAGRPLVRRRRCVKPAPFVALAVLAAGCGSTGRVDWAAPQTLDLGWRSGCGPRGHVVDVRFRRLELRRTGWRVSAGIDNRTGLTLQIARPHVRRGTFFGLAVFRSAAAGEVSRRAAAQALHPPLVAARFIPPLPRTLRPGQRWEGSFTGRGRIPSGRFVRVVVGRFTITGRPPRGLYRGFLCVSDRARRVR
jgi:SAM-dependent methyltransferase